MELLRISGKDLGQLVVADFCPRCFWVRRHAPKGLPYQVFPGIFSSIDSYTKRVVHQHFDVTGRGPDWLRPLGRIVRYREPPHWSKFNTRHAGSGVLLTGALDAIFERDDGSLVLADYKTAKFTGNQDALLPMYEVQLNAYAYIARALEWAPVSTLALIYTEPETEAAHAHPDRSAHPRGFSMGFAAKVLPVPVDLRRIEPMLVRVRDLVSAATPPEGLPGCKDCQRLAGIVALMSG
jgi:hypothetical protein